jgi:hypothetical protein
MADNIIIPKSLMEFIDKKNVINNQKILQMEQEIISLKQKINKDIILAEGTYKSLYMKVNTCIDEGKNIEINVRGGRTSDITKPTLKNWKKNNPVKWKTLRNIQNYLTGKGLNSVIDLGAYVVKGYCCGSKMYEYGDNVILKCIVTSIE